VFQRSPALPESTPLFPQAYAHTLDGQTPSWLPQLRPWLLSLVGVAALYILVAHLIWDRRSTSVSNRLEEILQHKEEAKQEAVSKKPGGRSESMPAPAGKQGGTPASTGKPDIRSATASNEALGKRS
jgi:hypothetical protein